jgi:uncharacterized lipoprotein YajG
MSPISEDPGSYRPRTKILAAITIASILLAACSSNPASAPRPAPTPSQGPGIGSAPSSG